MRQDLRDDAGYRMPTAHGRALSHNEEPYVLGSDPGAVAAARRELEADPSAKLGPPGATAPCMRDAKD